MYTNDDELAVRLRSIANHGMKVRYYHDNIGINSRLDTIQAAILSVKLKYLDQFNNERRNVADLYDKAFSGCSHITIPLRSSFSTHIFHQYTIKVPAEFRKPLRDHLAEKKIPSMVYYPVPQHLQNAYKYLGYKKGDFPVTEKLCDVVLSLPMCPELDREQLGYITSNILNYFETR
jgi:dTDP-4-amino-4,6-dideoxygalactose transaminase